jgi:hypothetical protein
MANEVYTEAEIKRALSMMKKDSTIIRGSWDKNSDEITFGPR